MNKYMTIRHWGMETAIDFFEDEESADEFAEEWAKFSSADIYVVKVKHEYLWNKM